MNRKTRYAKLQRSKAIAYMASLGRKGGPARAASLTPERRHQIATEAAMKRWEGHEKKKDTTSVTPEPPTGDSPGPVKAGPPGS